MTGPVVGQEQPQSDDVETRLALYKLYLETAEKVSDRRAGANTWMLSVNSAVVALYGWLGKDSALGSAAGTVAGPEQEVGLWAIPLAGILVSLAWAALLASYRQLNGAKFQVLHEMEKSLPHQPFALERELYKAAGRRGLAQVERWIPWGFAGLYALLLAARLLG